MSNKILIIGGVAGGASAAARLRRLDENAEIIVFEKGNYISFANCGLPYHISDVIKDRENLILQSPESFKGKLNINVRINSEIISIDAENKTLLVNSKEKGQYKETFDYLILSPGASPIKPPIKGIEDKNIFTLRNIDDMDLIKNYVENKHVKNAVVIGGGFIGVETAENLIEKGVNVSLVEAAPHILAPFDHDMVVMAEKELSDHGINLILNNGVEEFIPKENGLDILLKDGSRISSDMVVLAIGVAPDTKFLRDSTIALGIKGHILVNEHLETNINNIYAVGDAIEVKDLVSGTNTAIPLAGPANKQGRIAADNIAGIKSKYEGSLGTSVIKVFDLTCASTGNNEKQLQRSNIEYETIIIHPQSHASYYPGATPIALKLIFHENGTILGAQAIGYEGVEKRIDVIATALKFKGTVNHLAELELSYAPPYSSAKDPVNMAGFVAQNVITHKSHVVHPREVDKNINNNDILMLDVRTDLERQNGFIKNSSHIELNTLRDNLNKLDKSKEIWIYCQVGLRGYIAERILKEYDFKCKNITGGYKSYMALKFEPTKKEEEKPFNAKGEISLDVVEHNYTKTLDACGLSCPGPLMRTKAFVDTMGNNEIVKIQASDPGFFEDIKAWCKRTGNELLDINKEKGLINAFIKKHCIDSMTSVDACCSQSNVPVKDNKTMVVFSGDLDKAIASFIIANGAASMGKKVTMFFTFWGINILRKPEKVSVSKNFIEKMFGKMMPRGSGKLKLSNMNMGGIGSKMIRGIMKKHNVSSLEELIEAAIDSGIELVACQMSMELLGLRKEELLPGVKIGGVGYYLGEAEDSNVNLFI